MCPYWSPASNTPRTVNSASKKSVGSLLLWEGGHVPAAQPGSGCTTCGSPAGSAVDSRPSQHDGNVISDLIFGFSYNDQLSRIFL